MAPWFLRKVYSTSVLLPRQRRNSTGPEHIFRTLGSALPTSCVVLGTSPACRKIMLTPASRMPAQVGNFDQTTHDNSPAKYFFSGGTCRRKELFLLLPSNSEPKA